MTTLVRAVEPLPERWELAPRPGFSVDRVSLAWLDRDGVPIARVHRDGRICTYVAAWPVDGTGIVDEARLSDVQILPWWCSATRWDDVSRVVAAWPGVDLLIRWSHGRIGPCCSSLLAACKHSHQPAARAAWARVEGGLREALRTDEERG